MEVGKNEENIIEFCCKNELAIFKRFWKILVDLFNS